VEERLGLRVTVGFLSTFFVCGEFSAMRPCGWKGNLAQSEKETGKETKGDAPERPDDLSSSRYDFHRALHRSRRCIKYLLASIEGIGGRGKDGLSSAAENATDGSLLLPLLLLSEELLGSEVCSVRSTMSVWKKGGETGKAHLGPPPPSY
jgi:hypothetical protein